MRTYIPLILLALLLSACSGVTIGETPIGDLRTERISVPAPDADVATVHLKFGASDSFRLRPGAENLVEGSVQYNIDQLKPSVSTSGGDVTIEQRARSLNMSSNVRNEWDLRLSDAVPMALNVDAGAYKGSYDLGGVRLRAVEVNQGAAESTYDFSQPNPEPMDHLAFSSGAASVKLTHLANANAARMSFNVAAGSYTLDFGGTLARTMAVDVSAGASSLTIRVPSGTPARVHLKGGLSSADAVGFTSVGEKQYANAAWDESRPHIDISVDSAVGSVRMESN